MHNVLIITMLISLIYNYIFKRNVRSNLNCGIFAWVGESPSNFSSFMFNVLGVYNDSRGGDSCGVYFNKSSIIGIRTEAKYEALTKAKKLHTTIKPGKFPVVIGHCRKASVGTVSEVNIQPTLLRNPNKQDRLMYVQAHNGTISNHKELAKKYDIEVKADESDSVIISKVIEKVGFKALAEYDGTAALVMYFTKEPNVLYAFHGQSKQYVQVVEERPLHYLNIKGSGTYISSESAPLEFIGNGEKATSFKFNVVYRLEGDNVEEFQTIEREKAIIKNTTPVTPSKTTNYHDYYDDEYYGRENARIAARTSNLPTPPKPDSTLNQKGATRNICCSAIESAFLSLTTNTRITFDKGFYMVGENEAHGEIICDAFGYIRNPSAHYQSGNTAELYWLYFYFGILLGNKASYEAVLEDAKDLHIHTKEQLNVHTNFNLMGRSLREHSMFPFTKLTRNPGSGYMEPSKLNPNIKGYEKNTYYCGSFVPLFTDYEIFFKDGDFQGYKKNQGLYNISDFLKEFPEFEEYIGFGDAPDYANIKITSCKDCVDSAGYKDKESCMACTEPFKPEPTDEKGKVVETCMTCADKSCAFNHSTDYTGAECTSWVSEEELKDTRITMIHTIAEQLNPIISDIEDLISEIDMSGYKDTVTDEYDILNEGFEKLKEITK